jgi:hypothetical protein
VPLWSPAGTPRLLIATNLATLPSALGTDARIHLEVERDEKGRWARSWGSSNRPMGNLTLPRRSTNPGLAQQNQRRRENDGTALPGTTDHRDDL